VELATKVGGNNAVQLRWVVARFYWRQDGPWCAFDGGHVGKNASCDGERVAIVFGEMIGDTRDARVHVGATQLFGCNVLAGGRFDQGRPADEDRSSAFDDDGLVAH